MKNTLARFTLPLLTLPLVASTAYAQSSVTLYGIVDAGVVYVNNQSGHSNVETVTGQTNGSRFGIRGREDLGGGLKAIFWLENGFDTSNGKELQGSRLFGRQASVGLKSDTYGALTLGRQYEPMADLIGEMAAVSMWGWLGSHPGDFDNLSANFRINNSIRYESPVVAGLMAVGMFAPGGTAGDFATGRTYALGLKYSQGPFAAALAYDNINDPSLGVYDSTDPEDPGFKSAGKSPEFSGYESARILQIFGAAATYKFAHGGVGLVYTNTRFQNVLPTPTTPFRGGQATFNSYEINAHYDITSTLWMGAAFDYTKAQSAKYEQVSAGPKYYLSKSTDLELVGVWQHASGVDSTGNAAVAAIGSLGESTTPTQVAVKASIRHRF
jgi:predicted porin